MTTLSFGIMSTMTAQAQYRNDDYYRRNRDYNRDQRRRDEWNRRYGNWDRYDRYGASYQLRQTALNAGYNEGIKAGRKDRSRGEYPEFRDEGAYRSANKDYNSRLGDRYLYQQYFRQGFQNGYADGYRGY